MSPSIFELSTSHPERHNNLPASSLFVFSFTFTASWVFPSVFRRLAYCASSCFGAPVPPQCRLSSIQLCNEEKGSNLTEQNIRMLKDDIWSWNGMNLRNDQGHLIEIKTLLTRIQFVTPKYCTYYKQCVTQHKRFSLLWTGPCNGFG